MNESESIGLIESLPHRGPMCLIHRVLELSDDRSVTITQVQPDLGWLQTSDAEIPTYVGIELIAQSAAIVMQGQRPEKDEAKQGMIVRLKYFESYPRDGLSSSEWRTDCKVEVLADGALIQVSGRVFCQKKLLCVAELSLVSGGRTDG